MRRVIAYDIADDDVRARVAALLGKFGIRVQRSIFDCELDDEELAAMLEQVERMIDVDRDVVDVFGECPSCEDQRRHVGQSKAEVMGALWWVV